MLSRGSCRGKSGARHSEPPEVLLNDRRTTVEKQLAADQLTPDTVKQRQLLMLGRRESKYIVASREAHAADV